MSGPVGARSGESDSDEPGHASWQRSVPTRPQPAFRSFGWRAGNAVVAVLARTGIGPMHLLVTRGRTTGKPHTVPVVPIDLDGKRWLVAPYGTVSWVRNARVEGRVDLRYGRVTRQYAIREAGAEEAGPVLKRYLAVASKTRAQFDASPDSAVQDFVFEADRHPVFELVPVIREELTSD